LVYPKTEGLEVPVCTYTPQNLESLKDVIERSLTIPEERRNEIKLRCAEYVKAKDTWTIRMRQILHEASL
jgi:hypothetical protein